MHIVNTAWCICSNFEAPLPLHLPIDQGKSVEITSIQVVSLGMSLKFLELGNSKLQYHPCYHFISISMKKLLIDGTCFTCVP